MRNVMRNVAIFGVITTMVLFLAQLSACNDSDSGGGGGGGGGIAAAAACNDGKDNDGDGLIDYPEDPGCFSLKDKSEAFSTAAGVAVVLELARRFKDHPLPTTEIRFLGDGSEETYMHGMTCFMEAHQHELDKNHTYFLVPESCGNGAPRVVIGEGVSWIERHSPELCNLVLAAARELGYHDVEPIILRTGGTDMSPPTVRGFKATGIIAMNENDYVPNYHWHGDLPENVQLETLKKVTAIFEAAIKKIDAEF